MMTHDEIWQPRDGVYGVQYKKAHGWGIVLAVGEVGDARDHARNARYATTRLVRAQDGKWLPVPHTVRIGEGFPVPPLVRRPLTLAHGHIDRIRHLTGAKR